MSEHEEYDYARLEEENKRLRAALAEILKLSDCDGAGDAMAIAEAALKQG